MCACDRSALAELGGRDVGRCSANDCATGGRPLAASFAHGGAICRWMLLLVLRNCCAKTRRNVRAPRMSRPSARPCAVRDLGAAAAAVRPSSGDVSGVVATADFSF
ncbi:hypothetical protein F511_47352 [Dorcoceras hygrometricum]|uniref:Uncharacterized protein n=1 Tax=Dorcoceras hygrometricum TaxID=472368 RepID=A0A2Z6ZXR9_9LAMI|nr:hypothetical protein F511_47352 [Dorcoceras hygrometricum]